MKTTIDYDRSPGLARALFEESGNAQLLIDSNTNQILDANASVQRLCGISVRDLLGMDVSSLFRANGRGSQGVLALPTRITYLPYSEQSCQLRTFRQAVWLPVDVIVSRLAVKPKPLVLLTLRAAGSANTSGESGCNAAESDSTCSGAEAQIAFADQAAISLIPGESHESRRRLRS